MRIALVLGATGLVGSQLLKLLEEDSTFERIVVLSRKPLSLSSKCEVRIVNFDRLEEELKEVSVSDVFCCLGTTIRIAKTKEAFRKVDFEYPLVAGQVAKRMGAKNYYLVSALGANSKSKVFYNRVKGEVETALEGLDFEAFHIFRPSLLLGQRQEVRSGEGAATIFFNLFNVLIPKKYKAIDSLTVAKAMVHQAKQPGTGVVIHESGEMQNVA
jgi:uncharacterized protein YbjT (DUF2867 family)